MYLPPNDALGIDGPGTTFPTTFPQLRVNPWIPQNLIITVLQRFLKGYSKGDYLVNLWGQALPTRMLGGGPWKQFYSLLKTLKAWRSLELDYHNPAALQRVKKSK